MALKVGELFASFSIDSSNLDSSLSQITQQCNNVGNTMMLAGAGLSAAVTVPVVKAAKDLYHSGTEFEAQMSKVQAIAGLDSQVEADAAAIDALTQEAIYMGSTTEWTATQAGEALQYMAMAGWRTDAMLAGLPSVMNLATAAGSDLGTTSDIVTDAMTAFGLTLQAAGGDTEVFTGYVEHFTDVLAAAATNSNTNVELLGTSFRYVAPLAGSLGYSVDDVAVALGLMANSGVKSTMAGAALRNILNGLLGTTDKTAAACETLGVSLYDSHGNVKDLATVMGELRQASKNAGVDLEKLQESCLELDQKLEAGTITQEEYDQQLEELTAGSGDFLAACVALAGKQGLSGLLAIMNASDEDFANLTNAIANCDGATAQMAATMLDNAKGAMTIFNSAVEGLEITLWTLVSDSFVEVVKGATEIIQKFQALDGKTQVTVMKFIALSAAAGPLLVAGGRLVKMLPNLVSGIMALASPMAIVAGGLALFAVAAIDADNTLGKIFTSASKKAKKALQDLNKTITNNMKNISARMSALCKSLVEGLHDLIPEAMNTIALVIEGFMSAISDNADDISEIGKTVIVDFLDGLAANLPQLIPMAVKMVSSIATALISNVPDIVKAAGTLAGSIVQGFHDTDWSGIIEDLSTSINEALTSTTDLFSQWFDQATSYLSSLDWSTAGTNIADLILNGAVAAASTVGTFVSNLITAIGSYTGWSSIGSQLGTVAEHIITGIADAIPGLSDTVAGIITAIGNALSGEGAESLVAGFTSLATSIVNGVTYAIPKISDGAGKIVDAIAQMLNGLNFDSAVDALSSLGESLINMIVVGIQSGSDLAVNIANAIGSLFTEEGLATKLVTAGGNIASTLITAIGNAIPGVANAAINIVNAIGDLLSGDSSDAFASSVISVATTLIDSIVAAIPNVTNGAIRLIESISNLLTGEGATNLVSGFEAIASSIINGIIDAIPKVANAASNIILAIGKILGGEKTEDVASSLASLASSIVNGIIDAIPAVAGAAVNIMNAIGSLFTAEGAGTSIANGAVSIASAIVDAVIDGIPKLTTAASDIIAAIGELFSGEAAATKFEGATQIASSLMNAVVEAIPALTDLATGIIEAIGTALGGINWSSALDSVTSLGEALFNAIVAGLEGLGNVGVSIVEAIGNMLSDINWESVSVSLDGFGQMLVNGITKGLESLAGASVAIFSAIGDLFSDISWDDVGDVSASIANVLIDGIVAGIKGLANGAVQILDAIVEIFGKIEWSEVADTLSSLAQSIFDAITKGASEIVPDMSELISAIGRGIEAAASGLGELAGNLIGSLVTFILTPENWLMLIELGGKILEGIGTGITNLAESVLSGAWNAVASTFKSLFQSLGLVMSDDAIAAMDQMETVVNAEGEQIEAAVSGIYSHLTTLGSGLEGIYNEETLMSYVEAYNTCLNTGQQEIISSISQYNALGNEAVVGLFQTVVDTTASESQRAAALIALQSLGLDQWLTMQFMSTNPAIIAAAGEMSAGASDAFITAFTQLGYIIPDAVKTGLENGTLTVQEAAQQVVDAASTANAQAQAEASASATGSGITTSLSDAETDGEGDVETASDGVVDVAKLALETLPDAAEIVGQDTAGGMSDGITNNTDIVTTSMDTLADSVVQAALLRMTYTTGYDTGYEYVSAMKSGIDGMLSSITNSMGRIAQAVVDKAKAILSYINGFSAGFAFVSAISAGLYAGQGSASNSASAVANAAKTAASGVLSYSAGTTIGESFSAGIAHGILNGLSSVISAANTISNAAVNASKSTLKINSPSKVAESEIGLNYDEGIASGLYKGVSSIRSAASAVAADLHDSFYVGDPSRGTVYTSSQQATRNAQENASAANGGNVIDRATEIGRAIADRLIETGALEGDVFMDGDRVGRKVAKPVSTSISRKTKETIAGRSLQGVIA